MGWDGDISRMGRLAENIGKLARVPSRASARVAEEIKGLIENQFATGTDPYGNTYKPLTEYTLSKRTQTSEPPLTDTGTMRDSLRVEPMRAAGVSITIAHPGEDHQTGWSGAQGSGPARPVLPPGPLPRTWRDKIDQALDELVRDELGAA
jgi:hypothetical protein